MSTTAEDFLAHFGVKGMRWGVRRKAGSVSKSKQAPAHKRMSDEDLRKAVSRMQLEQSYSRLAGSTKSKAGADFVKKTATNTAKVAVAAVVTQQINAIVKKGTAPRVPKAPLRPPWGP